MANGIEVVLGWPFKEYAQAADLLRIKLPASDEEWDEVCDLGTEDWLHDHGKVDALNKAVLKAQREMLDHSAGFTYVGESDHGIIYKTPWGDRDFRLMSFQLYYDWNEMGDKPENTVVGVSISSRYRPVFLDADDPSGAIYHFILDRDMQAKVDLARACLVKHAPGFVTSNLIVVQQHY